MKIKTIKFKTISVLIIAVILLFGFSLTSYFYSRIRQSEVIYVKTILGQEYYTPRWIEEEINKNETDRSSFGRVNALVVDKESYEWNGPGKFVILLLKVSAIKDRSGIFLFKNRPLAIGETISLRFPRVNYSGTIIYIGNKLPENKLKKLKVIVKKRSELPEVAENIFIGDTITNNKNENILEIKDKRVTFAEVRTETSGGAALVSTDQTRRDIETTIELKAQVKDSNYIFMEIYKIKTGDLINLHLNKISLWDFRIISVEEI